MSDIETFTNARIGHTINIDLLSTKCIHRDNHEHSEESKTRKLAVHLVKEIQLEKA